MQSNYGGHSKRAASALAVSAADFWSAASSWAAGLFQRCREALRVDLWPRAGELAADGDGFLYGDQGLLAAAQVGQA